MPEARSYPPKFKTGYTVTSPRTSGDTEYVILFTYSGLVDFSSYGYTLIGDYNESDSAHTLYSCIQQFSDGKIAANWLFEPALELVCCNENRGKKLLLQNADEFRQWYIIKEQEKLNKFLASLQLSNVP